MPSRPNIGTRLRCATSASRPHSHSTNPITVTAPEDRFFEHATVEFHLLLSHRLLDRAGEALDGGALAQVFDRVAAEAVLAADQALKVSW